MILLRHWDASRFLILNDANNPSGYVQVLEERAGSNLSSYVAGRQGVISQNVNGTVTYLLMDGHGSTRLLTTTSGQVVGEYDYDGFGNVLTLSSRAKAWVNSITTPYQFAGMRADPLTGMDLTESRPYLPADGRFPIADSYIATPGDLNNANLYVYAGGNPFNGWDPNGHSYASDFGTAVHNEIAANFRERVGRYAITSRSIFSIVKVPYLPSIGTLLPDLVYFNQGVKKEVFEIKPDNVRQIIP